MNELSSLEIVLDCTELNTCIIIHKDIICITFACTYRNAVLGISKRNKMYILPQHLIHYRLHVAILHYEVVQENTQSSQRESIPAISTFSIVIFIISRRRNPSKSKVGLSPQWLLIYTCYKWLAHTIFKACSVACAGTIKRDIIIQNDQTFATSLYLCKCMQSFVNVYSHYSI